MKRFTMILTSMFFVFLAMSCVTVNDYQEVSTPVYEVKTVGEDPGPTTEFVKLGGDTGPTIEFVTGMGTNSEPDYSGHTFTAFVHIGAKSFIKNDDIIDNQYVYTINNSRYFLFYKTGGVFNNLAMPTKPAGSSMKDAWRFDAPTGVNFPVAGAYNSTGLAGSKDEGSYVLKFTESGWHNYTDELVSGFKFVPGTTYDFVAISARDAWVKLNTTPGEVAGSSTLTNVRWIFLVDSRHPIWNGNPVKKLLKVGDPDFKIFRNCFLNPSKKYTSLEPHDDRDIVIIPFDGVKATSESCVITMTWLYDDWMDSSKKVPNIDISIKFE